MLGKEWYRHFQVPCNIPLSTRRILELLGTPTNREEEQLASSHADICLGSSLLGLKTPWKLLPKSLSICWKLYMLKNFPGGSVVKNQSALPEMHVQSLGLKDPLEKEMVAHPTVLAWEIHGQRSLAGYGLQGRKGSNITRRLNSNTLFKGLDQQNSKLSNQGRALLERSVWNSVAQTTQIFHWTDSEL